MGFWGTLGKIGLIAGAGALTAATGGAASPALMAAIGAGTGAATGAMGGGGWKGALTGAALGGATGGLGGGAAGAAASQGVGGALKSGLMSALKNPQVLGAAGQAIGGMGAAATANRGATADFDLQAGRDFENAAMNRELLKLRQADDMRTAESDAFRKALQSALVMNTQDFKFDRSGFRSPVADISFSGGARPSALGTQGREAAELLNNQVMQRLMAGPEERAELPELERAEMPKASIWERLAGPVGLGLSAAGAIGDSVQRNKPRPPVVVPAAETIDPGLVGWQGGGQ